MALGQETRGVYGLGKKRIAQLVNRLAGFGDGKVGGLLQRGASVGALQQMRLGLARDVFFNARRDAVAARCRHRLGKDAAVFVERRDMGHSQVIDQL